MGEAISSAISRAEKCFTKRGKDNEDNFGQEAKYKVIYIGGRWDTTEAERRAIAKGIRKFNAESFLDGEMERGIMLPIFEAYDDSSSRLGQTEETHASVSDAYFEIIGNGFGDTSFDLARVAYETARKLDIPTGILVKEQRTAKNPHYALDFLKLVRKNEILRYDNPDDAAAVVEDWLRTRFK